jgi:hypothetical protein
MYVVGSNGNRIICPHPREFKKVYEVLGDEVTQDEIKQKTGHLSACVCTDCLVIIELDLERDVKICPTCNSDKVVSFAALRGRRCPKCNKGIIQEHLHGLWT